MKYTAVYDRYHKRYTEEFDTLEDATLMLAGGTDGGDLYAIAITQGDSVVIEGDELRARLHKIFDDWETKNNKGGAK